MTQQELDELVFLLFIFGGIIMVIALLTVLSNAV